MRSIIVFLIIALIGLQYKLWFGNNSILQWHHLEEKIADQRDDNDKLTARNRMLEADILELKNGDQALEEQARYELGMIKENEVFYQIVD